MPRALTRDTVDIFLQQIINGLVLGSIYALVALGYTMVYGILGLINFAHGDIVMIGALVSLSIFQPLAASGMPVPVILLVPSASMASVSRSASPSSASLTDLCGMHRGSRRSLPRSVSRS